MKQLLSKGKTSVRKMTHAQILLHADEDAPKGPLKDAYIAISLHISCLTVERVRKRFVQESLESALNPNTAYLRKTPYRLMASQAWSQGSVSKG